jgi:hypothetical protein
VRLGRWLVALQALVLQCRQLLRTLLVRLLLGVQLWGSERHLCALLREVTVGVFLFQRQRRERRLRLWAAWRRGQVLRAQTMECASGGVLLCRWLGLCMSATCAATLFGEGALELLWARCMLPWGWRSTSAAAMRGLHGLFWQLLRLLLRACSTSARDAWGATISTPTSTASKARCVSCAPRL